MTINGKRGVTFHARETWPSLTKDLRSGHSLKTFAHFSSLPKRNGLSKPNGLTVESWENICVVVT